MGRVGLIGREEGKVVGRQGKGDRRGMEGFGMGWEVREESWKERRWVGGVGGPLADNFSPRDLIL